MTSELISELKAFAHFEEGKLDLQFGKVGLDRINILPNNWIIEGDSDGLVLRHLKSDETVEIGQRVKHLLGSKLYVHDSGIDVEVVDIRLIRLDDVTEDMAKRSGLELLPSGYYKHYCPEQFFPKKVLKNQTEGYPGYSTAKGSFMSRWVKAYGLMEIYRNPWIWVYQFMEAK